MGKDSPNWFLIQFRFLSAVIVNFRSFSNAQKISMTKSLTHFHFPPKKMARVAWFVWKWWRCSLVPNRYCLHIECAEGVVVYRYTVMLLRVSMAYIFSFSMCALWCVLYVKEVVVYAWWSTFSRQSLKLLTAEDENSRCVVLNTALLLFKM